MGLSVGMITWNEARRVRPALEAVRGWADEIVVIDAGSTDGTREICRELGAQVIERDWPGYGVQKNAVVDRCREEWILMLDADEVVTPGLREEIDAVMDDPDADVYAIPFEHVVFGRRVRHSGWHGQERIRLFRRGAGRWAEVEVHEGFETNREVGRLKNFIEHHPYIDLDHYRLKADHYTTLEAKKALRCGERPRLCRAAARAIYGFLRMYVWKRGFLDGAAGFWLALYSGRYFFVADRKLARLRAPMATKRGDSR